MPQLLAYSVICPALAHLLMVLHVEHCVRHFRFSGSVKVFKNSTLRLRCLIISVWRRLLSYVWGWILSSSLIIKPLPHGALSISLRFLPRHSLWVSQYCSLPQKWAAYPIWNMCSPDFRLHFYSLVFVNHNRGNLRVSSCKLVGASVLANFFGSPLHWQWYFPTILGIRPGCFEEAL